MIRWVFIAAMSLVLCIVLYIPSRVPADRFMDVLRAEHAVTERVMGAQAANRVLARMLAMQQVAQPLSEPPPATVQGNPGGIDAAVSTEVAQMSMRLFNNPYFRSIDALMVLVSYRLSAAVEIIPLLSVFLIVVCVDGFVLRAVRAREFIAHSAEMFGVSIVGAILVLSGVVVVWFLPVELNPTFVTLAFLTMLFLLSRAVANYHVIH